MRVADTCRGELRARLGVSPATDGAMALTRRTSLGGRSRLAPGTRASVGSYVAEVTAEHSYQGITGDLLSAGGCPGERRWS
ncbi:MAG TPA: hypothetical protein VNZ26_35260 [Vicinamibacterales bacterium]|jgi:hypothetical protein|nr:hypothetical protein [Vicinamibacterales bacterium]